MTWEEIQAALGRIADLTDDELAEVRAAIRQMATDLADEDYTDEVRAQYTALAEGADAVKAEEDARATAAADAEADRQANLDRIAAALADPETEGDDDDGETDDADEDAPTDEAKVPVAAAATPKAAPVISRVAARRPPETKATARPVAPRISGLVASANLPGIQGGADLTSDPDLLARAFVASADMAKTHRGAEALFVPYARASIAWDDARLLTSDARSNESKIEAVAGDKAIVASGGKCAPSPYSYDLPIIGDDQRPVRDALARFGADRGGVNLIAPPVQSSMDAAVNVWTDAVDQSPGSQTKGCLTMTCPSATETVVEAITRCIKFGNFRARFFPEQVEAWNRLVLIRHAREAEARLLTAISSGSTAVTTGTGTRLGTARHILADIDRAVAGFQGRHRAPNTRFRMLAPWWLYMNMRVDIARQMPVGTVDETFVLAEAQIRNWFESRGVTPTWFYDGLSGQDMAGAQGAGPLNNWPTTVDLFLYPEGSWLFLDGGTLDLGLVRDSTLNGTNDVQMFGETFEKAAFHGVESLKITADICPDGSASALIDIDPCTTGS